MYVEEICIKFKKRSPRSLSVQSTHCKCRRRTSAAHGFNILDVFDATPKIDSCHTNRLVIDGFVISENLHNTLTANTLFGITSKKDVHIGHDDKTWVLEGDIICDTCYHCDNCTSCVACTSCDDCTTCQACQGCTGFCTSCASGCHNTCFGDCYTCQDCQTGCTGCDGCTTNCTTGCNTSCYSCVSCQNCDATCQGCDGCTAGCTGSCQTICQSICQGCTGQCQGCTSCTSCDGCQNETTCTGCTTSCASCTGCTGACQTGCTGQCQGCTGCDSCTGCASCTSCIGCNSCTGCTGCTGCTACNGACTGCTSCVGCTGSCQGGCTTCDGGCTTSSQNHKLDQYCPSDNSNGYDAGVCNQDTGIDPYAFLNNIPDWIQAACGLTEEEWDAMTPEQQKDTAKEIDPDCEIEEHNNTNSVLTAKEDLAAALQGDYDVSDLIPKAENCEGGQTTVEYYSKTTGEKVLEGTIGADGKTTLTATDGTSYEYTNNNETGRSDKTQPSEKTNPDGSKNTQPTNPENTSTPSTYTPPPSSENLF